MAYKLKASELLVDIPPIFWYEELQLIDFALLQKYAIRWVEAASEKNATKIETTTFGSYGKFFYIVKATYN